MLIPKNRYPGQTDTGDAGFPEGKARNATTLNDGTGFPIEKDWVNDLLGAKQALVDEAGVTPSGDPDKVGASDELDALDVLYYRKSAVDTAVNAKTTPGNAKYSINAGTTVSPVNLTESFADAGYSLNGGNAIEVPSAGTYLVNWAVKASADGSSVSSIVSVLDVGGSSTSSVDALSDGSTVYLSKSTVVQISDPATERLSVDVIPTGADPGDAQIVAGGTSEISVVRVSS